MLHIQLIMGTLHAVSAGLGQPLFLSAGGQVHVLPGKHTIVQGNNLKNYLLASELNYHCVKCENLRTEIIKYEYYKDTGFFISEILFY